MTNNNKIWIIAGSVISSILIIAILLICGYAILMNRENRIYANALSMDDIYIPDAMDKNNLGLFWQDAAGKRYRYDSDDALNVYDPKKPIIIYIHGWGGGGSIDEPAKWIAKGYNVGIMRWGEMSNSTPFDGQSKLWGINKNMFYWIGDDGKKVTDDVPSHCLAQIFVACLNDFLNEHGFYGSELRLMGHSLGGQATIAMSSYMLTAAEQGLLNPDYLPDRITMLDPYINDMSDPTYVSWLPNVSLSEGGSTKLIYLTCKALREKGIAVEGIRTSVVRILGNLMSTGYYAKLSEYITWIDVASDFYPDTMDLFDNDSMSAKHIYSIDWTSDMLGQGKLKDYAFENDPYAFAWSPELPSTYVYARGGSLYSMPSNLIEKDMSDDKQYSDSASAKIAGFAFWDDNRNGINDDRAPGRIKDVKIKLYSAADHQLVAETTTDSGGYYEFLLGADSYGKSFYIGVEKESKITLYPGAAVRELNWMNCNDIGADKKSQTVEIIGAGTLHILNAGFKRSFFASLEA